MVLGHGPCLTRDGYGPRCVRLAALFAVMGSNYHRLTLRRHELTMLSHRVGDADIITFVYIDFNRVLLHSICYWYYRVYWNSLC